MKCPKCGKEMKDLGNLSGIIYTTYPVQWDTTYVCEECKTKRVVRQCGVLEEKPDISDYTEV